MKKKRFALVLATMAVVGVLTACGGKSEEKTTTEAVISEEADKDTSNGETSNNETSNNETRPEASTAEETTVEEEVEIVENFRLDSIEKTSETSVGELKDKLPATIDDFMGFYVANNDYDDAVLVSDRISGDETIGYGRTWGVNAYPTKDDAIAAKEKGNVLINIFNGASDDALPVSDCLELGDIRLTAMTKYGEKNYNAKSDDIFDVNMLSIYKYFSYDDVSVFEGKTLSETDAMLYQQYVDKLGAINYYSEGKYGSEPCYTIGWAGDDYAILMEVLEDTNACCKITQIHLYSRNYFDVMGYKAGIQ